MFKSIFFFLTTLMTSFSPLAADFQAVKKLADLQESRREMDAAVVVLGGGIGALTSALYLSRAGLEPLVIEGPAPGGLLTQSHSVQNWPGEMEIEGGKLAEKIRSQAAANGAVIRSAEVVDVDFSKRPFTLTIRSLDGGEALEKVRAAAVIVAMGTQPNFLGVPGETGPNGYWGRGVTNCATCDGSLYKDQVVGVVGGGDAAVLEALYLSNIAKEVHVFVRKDAFRGTEEKRAEAMRAKPNIKVHFNTSVQEIQGDGEKLTRVILKQGKRTSEFPLNGLFLAIGSTPNTALFKKALPLDEKGYIRLKNDQQTAVEGVFAIGDIVDPVYKQAISAAGDGAKAALQAQRYVADRMDPEQLRLAKAKTDPSPVPVAAPIAAPIAALARDAKRSDHPVKVIEIASQAQFKQELEESDVPVVVDFYATWCQPCKRIAPMIEASAVELKGKVKFLKVDVDQFLDLGKEYNIRSMPTVLVFDAEGNVSDQRVGTDEIAKLLKQLKKNAE